jgi:hypothetical protein
MPGLAKERVPLLLFVQTLITALDTADPESLSGNCTEHKKSESERSEV